MTSKRDEDQAETGYGFIGRNIRDLRKKRKWTQAQLGQRLAHRKLSRQAIAWVESGRNTDLATIDDIATTLGVNLLELTRQASSTVRVKWQGG